jgi:hypothetical protein
VTYTPDPAQDMPEETTQFGYYFAKGKSVDVTDEAHLKKFRGNQFFHVDGKEGEHTLAEHKENAPRIQQDEQRKAQGLPPLPPEDDEPVRHADKPATHVTPAKK